MSGKLSVRPIGGALLVLLAASLAGNVVLYSRATRPLYGAQDVSLIERTLAKTAIQERMSPDEVRRLTFPLAMHLGGRTCVEIRARDGSGSHGACYDRSGTLVEQFDNVDLF